MESKTALRGGLDFVPVKGILLRKAPGGVFNLASFIAMSFMQYLRDTRTELRHVAWPTRTQTTVFTAFVAILSVFVALYLGVFDLIFTQGLERVLERTAPASELPAGILDIATTTSGETEDAPIIIE